MLLSVVATMGSLAFMDAELWHRCWRAHDRFVTARNALWSAKHPEDSKWNYQWMG